MERIFRVRKQQKRPCSELLQHLVDKKMQNIGNTKLTYDTQLEMHIIKMDS